MIHCDQRNDFPHCLFELLYNLLQSLVIIRQDSPHVAQTGADKISPGDFSAVGGLGRLGIDGARILSEFC